MKKLLLISQILFLPLMAQSTQLKRSVSATTSVQAESEAYKLSGTLGQNVIGGLILRDPSGAIRTDVTPTAANIVAAITNATVGTSFEVIIKNQADADEDIRFSAGTGVTIVDSNTPSISFNTTGKFLVVLTNVTSGSEEVSFYFLDT